MKDIHEEGKSIHTQTSSMRGSNSALALRGTISTLVGATRVGSERTCEESVRSSKLSGQCIDVYPTLNVLFSAPKRVLEERIQNPAEPE